MRVLIDTNIFIQRENDHILQSNLQKLLNILNKLKIEILIHPNSIMDIERDTNEIRKKIMLSKIKTYSLLESPPEPNDNIYFLNIVGLPLKPNDYVDNSILYSVYKEALDFLISQDNGIHKKANRLSIRDRVLSIEDALKIFEKNFTDKNVVCPLALKKKFVYNLDISDPFFDSFKKEYKYFETWFKKISREGRECWVYFKSNGMIGALLIYKAEEESIDSNPPLPKKMRLKISTFKVTHIGQKIGELFIKLIVKYCIKNNLTEMYLTLFTKSYDYLVDLISEYGFYKVARKRNGEDVFIKELLPSKHKIKSFQHGEISKKFYPTFYDGLEVNKFIVPIRPKYHERLFVDYPKRQLSLDELSEFITEGNTIKKAYICHSRIRRIKSGDILLFYRSRDRKELTSLGAVEKVFPKLQDPDKIIKLVGKRTVYSLDDICEIAKKPTIVILFIWHFHLVNPLKLRYLKKIHILKEAPQSITQISNEKYLWVKDKGGIDECFTIN